MSDDRRYYHNDKIVTELLAFSDAECQTPNFHGTGTNSSWSFASMSRHRPLPRVLLPTPAEFGEHLWSYVPGTFYCVSRRTGDWSWTHGSASIISKRDFSSAGDLAQVRLNASLNLSDVMVNFGEDYHDLDETGRMILRRARQIASMASDLRRGNWRGLANQLKRGVPANVKSLPASKRLANGWLELEFGWKPLISDVYGSIDAYRSRQVTGVLINGYASNGVKAGRGWSQSGHVGRASTKTYGNVVNPSLRTLNQLGLANPLLLAWQILPYSFVVDWFLPISNILAYLSAGAGLSSVTECSTYESGYIAVWSQGGGTFGSKSVYRLVRARPLFPDITRLSTRSLGIWHAATASALVRNSFHR